MNTIKVYIKILEGGRMPEYTSLHAAGCDLYAAEDMILRPGETKVIPLNFILAMDKEIEAQIRPRSGLSLKTELRIPNSPGTIDSDYRCEVGVIVQNTCNLANLPYQVLQDPSLLRTLQEEYRTVSLGEYLRRRGDIVPAAIGLQGFLQTELFVDKQGNPYGTIYIKEGERIAQMVFAEYKRAEFIPHDNPAEIGHNRGGGFGHSGV